jgi:hypothetical protein
MSQSEDLWAPTFPLTTAEYNTIAMLLGENYAYDPGAHVIFIMGEKIPFTWIDPDTMERHEYNSGDYGRRQEKFKNYHRR